MAGLLARLFGRLGPGVAAGPTPASPGAGPDERRALPLAAMSGWLGHGTFAPRPRDFGALAREGYQANAIAHRCVRLISEAAAATPLLLYKGDRELATHPLLDLLARPNPQHSGASLLETVFGHLMVAGNAYLHVSEVDGWPREMHALRPDRMQVVVGDDGWPAGWDYRAGARTTRFVALPGQLSPVLHLKQFHPTDDHYGFSPMQAAAQALDLHNAAAQWNTALLENAARPSGALVYAGPQGASLTDAQFERLRGEMEAQYQGAANAGRPLLLDGGLDWKPLSLTPRDMDFTEARAAAAREIALALGTPPLVLGLPGDSTYSNYAEANRAFWRQTILPLVQRSAASITHWLSPAFGEDLRLAPDLDAIEALALERESLWRRVSAASFLSDDERRAAVGYGREGVA